MILTVDIGNSNINFGVFDNDDIKFVARIATDRANELKIDFFDTEFNHLDIRQKYPNASVMPHKPETFEKMLELAK